MNALALDSDKLREAAKFWRAGDSGSVIAEKLGVRTRDVYNLIRYRRDMFAFRKAQKPEVVGKPEEPRRGGQTGYMPGLDTLRVLPVGGEQPHIGPLSLLQLTDRTCRWPIAGAGTATRFCGYCIPKGTIYCEAHLARSREGRC